MTTVILLSLAGAVIAAVVGIFWYSDKTPMGMDKLLVTFSLVAVVLVAIIAGYAVYSKPLSSPKNATYTIAGQKVTLKDGSNLETGTRYFGNDITTDLDGDGREDTVFLLTQQTGGSGVFYYAVAALNTEHGYVGSEAIFLGDRIAPQTTEKGKGKIVVINYADRAFGEPFTTPPSIGKSIWILLDVKTMQFGEVVQNFEGESA